MLFKILINEVPIVMFEAGCKHVAERLNGEVKRMKGKEKKKGKGKGKK